MAVVSLRPRSAASVARERAREQKIQGPPIIPPDVVLWAAEQSDYVGYNPWYAATSTGIINVGEAVLPACIVGLLLSAPLLLPQRTLLAVAFAFGHVSLLMLLGALSSPFTDTYMPLSLYFFLFQMVGCIFYLVASANVLWNAGDDVPGKIAAVSSRCPLVGMPLPARQTELRQGLQSAGSLTRKQIYVTRTVNGRVFASTLYRHN